MSETITSTFTNKRDPDFVVQETQRVISNFMTARTDTTLTNEPNLNDRFLAGGSNGQGNIDSINMSFAASLRAIRRTMNKSDAPEPSRNLDMAKPRRRQSIQQNHSSVRESYGGSFAINVQLN